jgi:L-fucose mutarotase
MLKGVPKIISPDLLKILASMGHGDELVISDAHFPAHSICSNVVRADAVGSPEMMKAILKLIELDQYVEKPVMLMEPVPGDAVDPDLLAEIKTNLGAADAERIDYIERFAFYERAKKAFAVVVSGETRIYGNIIIKKGVTQE